MGFRPARISGGVPDVQVTPGTPGTTDGQGGFRLVGADLEKYDFRWFATPGKWIGDTVEMLTQGDVLAMDLGQRTATQLLDWSKFESPVPYGSSFAQLAGSTDFTASGFTNGTATLNVNSTASPHTSPFAGSGQFRVRSMQVTYTGKTTTTLTGCTVISGVREIVPAGVDVVQGAPGGYGCDSNTLDHVIDMWTLGFRLQVKLNVLCNAAPDGTQMMIAPYWREYDDGDGSTDSSFATGGIGLSAAITSTTNGGGDKIAERQFTKMSTGWVDWAAGVPTKHHLQCDLMGKMSSGSDTGEVLDASVELRWVA